MPLNETVEEDLLLSPNEKRLRLRVNTGKGEGRHESVSQ